MLSIQCLSISLSVTLVLVTGGIIGGLSITMGNEATDQTKAACGRGLSNTNSVCRAGFAQLDTAANDGVNQSLTSGRDAAEMLTQLVMEQALSTITGKVTSYFDVMQYSIDMLKETIYGIPVEKWGSLDTWDDVLRPLGRSIYFETFKRGVSIVSMQWNAKEWKDGVDQRRGTVYTFASEVEREENGYAGHNIVQAIRFECDGLNQVQCAAAECVWCRKAGDPGYCGNPMRRDPPNQITGIPQVCRPGWSPPAGYTLKWYQTSTIPFVMGMSDKHGMIYKGSCGLDDLECSCKARNDFRLKKGDDLATTTVGRYKRFDGTHPEPGQVPKGQLLEAGICTLPEGLAGLQSHRTVRQETMFGNDIQHWTPLYGGDVAPLLNVHSWVSIQRGDQRFELYAGVNLHELSRFMASSDLPRDSRMYLAQTDSWKRLSPCQDDFFKMLGSNQLNCPLAMLLVGALAPDTPPCEVDLNVVSPFIARMNFVKEHCPVTCGVCEEQGQFGLWDYDGFLIGASHGTYYRALPIEQSQFWEQLGVRDIVAKRVWESEDYIVANHSTHVMQELGGFLAVPKDSTWHDREGRLWWVKSQTITLGELDRSQLKMTLVLLVLRDAAMEVIDEATEKTGREIAEKQAAARSWFEVRELETAAQIREDEKDTDRQKQEGFMIMLIVTAVSVIILLVVSVVFVKMIIKPLLVLEGEMAEVAVMHLETVDRDRPPSLLSEVAEMQSSFLQMVKNLIEYRNYMPASVLCGSDDEEEEGEETRGTASEGEKTGESPRASKSSVAGSQASAAPVKRRTSNMSKMSRNTAVEVKAKAAMEEGLKKKNTSFAVLTVRGWHSESQGKGDDWISKLHTEVLIAFLSAFQESKGVPDVFSGDRILCSFNGIKANRQHKPSSSRAALRAATKGTEVVSKHSQALGISAAVASGEVHCGNSGCPGMKRFAFFSTVVPWVWALERVNNKFGTSILIDSTLLSELKGVMELRAIDALSFPKRFKAVTRVWEIIALAQVSEDEWMYQLEEGEKNNKYIAWDKYVDAILSNNWEADISDLRSQVDKTEGVVSVPVFLSQRFDTACERQRHDPFEVLLH